MFRRRRYDIQPRPYATYLLPSFPSLGWNKKVSDTDREGPEPVISHRYGQTPPVDSHRFSVASASSTASAATTTTVTSTGSQATAPSLSTSLLTSPTSETDFPHSPQSLSGTPIATPFPIFDTIDYQQPTFAEFEQSSGEIGEAVIAGETETETVENIETLEPYMYKPAPQVETNTPTRPSPPATPSPPTRRLERVFPTTLRCQRCSADFAFASQIVSKGFTGRHGRAYLVSAPATSANHLFAPEVGHADADDPWDESQISFVETSDSEEDVDGNGNGNGEGNSQGTGRPRPIKVRRYRPGGARDLPNISIGRPENRRLVTGAHVVADISCAVCGTKVGWKYVDASDPAQKYKVGKFILEINRIATHHHWEDVVSTCEGANDESAVKIDGQSGPSPVNDPLGATRQLMARYQLLHNGEDGGFGLKDDFKGRSDDNGRIEFDSDDEDECEDIFLGTWDAAVVARRRAAKRAAAIIKNYRK